MLKWTYIADNLGGSSWSELENRIHFTQKSEPQKLYDNPIQNLIPDPRELILDMVQVSFRACNPALQSLTKVFQGKYDIGL